MPTKFLTSGPLDSVEGGIRWLNNLPGKRLVLQETPGEIVKVGRITRVAGFQFFELQYPTHALYCAASVEFTEVAAR